MGVLSMKPLTAEWVSKAESDYLSAKREYRARKHPNYDLTAFLAQQCAEKYLKGRLQEAGQEIAKTHNLVHLLDSCVSYEPLWEALRTSLTVLNTYAVAFRYPGEYADKETAKDALRIAAELRRLARESLRISD